MAIISKQQIVIIIVIMYFLSPFIYDLTPFLVLKKMKIDTLRLIKIFRELSSQRKGGYYFFNLLNNPIERGCYWHKNMTRFCHSLCPREYMVR